MKTRILSLTLALSLGSLTHTTQASNVTFKATNDTFATKVCYVAATEGLQNAKKAITQEGYSFDEYASSVSCNGQSLRGFSRAYYTEAQAEKVSKRIKLVLENDRLESQVCVDAIAIGEDAAREQHNLKSVSIICNGSNISSFLRKYRNENVLVSTSTY